MKQDPAILNIPHARVRVPLMMQLYGIGRSTLYRRVKEQTLPKPFYDGPNCPYWPAAVVTEHLSASK
jgi:predicted DNA-binding transcriptional regulator AlpA